MSKWDEEQPPEREWAVFNRYPMYQPSLFSGEGGAGKSLLKQMLCSAHALGRDWLGTLPESGNAIFIDAEEDDRELQRRQKIICDHYGATHADAIKGGLHLMSFAGQDAIFATVTRGGKVEPTPLYKAMLQAAGDIKPKMIAIASAANIYAGDESVRTEVQQFVGLLTRMAILAHGAMALISHPSNTGIANETGLSGSTQWHNAVRARAYLKASKPKPESSLTTTSARSSSKRTSMARRARPSCSSGGTGCSCRCRACGPSTRRPQSRKPTRCS
jgi:RecA-family ATPase